MIEFINLCNFLAFMIGVVIGWLIMDYLLK